MKKVSPKGLMFLIGALFAGIAIIALLYLIFPSQCSTEGWENGYWIFARVVSILAGIAYIATFKFSIASQAREWYEKNFYHADDGNDAMAGAFVLIAILITSLILPVSFVGFLVSAVLTYLISRRTDLIVTIEHNEVA